MRDVTHNPYDFPTWDTMQVTWGGELGKFDLIATFRNVKGNSINDATRSKKTLRFHIVSPQRTRNLVFSIAHRLLVIALRRGAIDGIETLDELFAKDNFYIRWKPEFSKKPIFLAGGHRGLSVQDDVPLGAHAPNEYLARRAKRMVGYPSGK